jgi:hypothetical protein
MCSKQYSCQAARTLSGWTSGDAAKASRLGRLGRGAGRRGGWIAREHETGQLGAVWTAPLLYTLSTGMADVGAAV